MERACEGKVGTTAHDSTRPYDDMVNYHGRSQLEKFESEREKIRTQFAMGHTFDFEGPFLVFFSML